jgi:cysteine desulfurase
MDEYTYLDNNGTTIMPNTVKDEIFKWMNKGNPSAFYAESMNTPKLIEKFKDKVANICELNRNDYEIIITSCASESNNFILRSAASGFISCTRRLPHIIISSIEHKSLMECAIDLKKNERIELSIVPPNTEGYIASVDVGPYLQANTALVCVMSANNETGIINNTESIGNILIGRRIPFYVDCVQTFGKFPVRPERKNITAFCASFHKLGGPPGIGILVALKSFIRGYKLKAEICGAQNNGFRGGTENIPYIAGSLAAMRETYTNRELKNKNMMALQLFTIRALMSKIPTSFFQLWTDLDKINVTGIPNYKNTNLPPNVEMVVMGTPELIPGERYKKILPNTIMLAFIIHNVKDIKEDFVEGGGDIEANARPICNYKMATLLQKAGIIVGLGSACNSGQNSYVLASMGVPKVVASSTIRISYCDTSSEKDAHMLIREILMALQTIIK